VIYNGQGEFMATYVVDFLNAFVGLRKTIVMLAVLILTSVFRVKGYVTPDNFENVIKSTVIAFFGSNSIEHYTTMVTQKLLANGKTQAVAEIETATGTG
jgi:hypothetical protein